MMAGEPIERIFVARKSNLTLKRASHARPGVLQIRHITAFS